MKKIPFELQERINSPTEITEILKAAVDEKKHYRKQQGRKVLQRAVRL